MAANENILKKVGLASFIMMASVFASRIIGVFREMTIAGIGGIQSSVDAYQIAFIIPEILNHVVASGFLSITFIPIFAHYLSCGRQKEGYRVFSIVMNGFGLVLLIFILITWIWAPGFVHLFVPGIQDPDTFALAVKMTRIIIPAQFFFFTGGLLMAIQFANEKFLIPALAPLIYNLAIILGGIILGPFIGMEGFAWGVQFGAFMGNFALQLVGAHQVVNPEQEFGKRLANRLLYRSIIVDTNLGEDLHLTEIRIQPGMIGKTLMQLSLPKRFGVMVAGIRRGNPPKVLQPSASETLQADDSLIIVSSESALPELTKGFQS